MEIGRNIKFDDRYYIAFRYEGEKLIRRWYFNTHRSAMIKFNKLSKTTDWLPVQEDVTI